MPDHTQLVLLEVCLFKTMLPRQKLHIEKPRLRLHNAFCPQDLSAALRSQEPEAAPQDFR